MFTARATPALSGDRWQQIACGMGGYAPVAVANTSSFTQVQSFKRFFAARDFKGLKVCLANVLIVAGADVAMPDCTMRAAIKDVQTGKVYPFFINGSRDVTLSSGQYAWSDELSLSTIFSGAFTSGKEYEFRILASYATAPANFPAAAFIADNNDISEWGNALTDKTLSGTISGRVSGYAIAPMMAMIGRVRSRTPVGLVLGDSITSQSLNDATSEFYNGYVFTGLAQAGIPFISVGNSGLSFSSVIAGSYTARLQAILDIARTAGVSHCFCPLGINDTPTATGAQMISVMQQVGAKFRAAGIKFIPSTLSPRTNVANTAESSAGVWQHRRDYNFALIALNGLGDGFHDAAPLFQDAATTDIWRSDLLKVTAASAVSGGAGYANGHLLYLPGGVMLAVSGSSGGAVTAVQVKRGGGALSFATPAAQTGIYAGLAAGGGGATFNYTTAAMDLPADGLHPSPPLHAFGSLDPRGEGAGPGFVNGRRAHDTDRGMAPGLALVLLPGDGAGGGAAGRLGGGA